MKFIIKTHTKKASNSKNNLFLLVIIRSLECTHNRRQILSSRRGLFEGPRTDASEITVVPGPFIEDFYVIEDIRPRPDPGFYICVF